MKLHLPSGLRKALLACLAAVALPAASIPTTLASASGIAAVFLAASQRASAEFPGPSGVDYGQAETWQADPGTTAKMTIYKNKEVTLSKDAPGWSDTNNPRDILEYEADGKDLNLKVNGTDGDITGYTYKKLGDFKTIWFTGKGRHFIATTTELSNSIGAIYVNGAQLVFGDGVNLSGLTMDFYIGASTAYQQTQSVDTSGGAIRVGANAAVVTSGTLHVEEDAVIRFDGGNLTFGAISGEHKLSLAVISGKSGSLTLTSGGSVNGLDMAATSQITLTSGTFTAGAISATEGASIVLHNGAKLNFSGITGKLTINLSKFTEAGTYEIFDSGVTSWLNGGHTSDWNQYLAFSGINNGLECQFVTVSGADYGKLKITGTFQASDLTIDGKLTWDTVEVNELTWKMQGASDNWSATGTDANWNESSAWDNSGNTKAIFNDTAGETVTLLGSVKTGAVEVQQGEGWEFKVESGNSLTVSRDLTVSGSAKLKLSGKGKIAAHNVDLTNGSLELNGADLQFGSITGGAGSLTGTGYALYVGGGSMSWSDFLGKYGSVLGDSVGVGAADQALTITDAVTLDKSFKAGDNSKATFSGNVTFNTNGKLVLGDDAEIVLGGTLAKGTGDVSVTHEGTEGGMGKLTMSVGGNAEIDMQGMSFGEGVILHVDGPSSGTGVTWGTIKNLNVLGELQLAGHEVILNGTNTIKKLDASGLTGKFSLTEKHEKTTLQSSSEVDVEVDMRAGELAIGTGTDDEDTTLTLKGGLRKNSGSGDMKITGANLTFAGSFAEHEWEGGLNLKKLTMSGGTQKFTGTGSNATLSVGPLVVTGGSLTMGSADKEMTVKTGGINITGGIFTWAGSKMTVSGDITMSGVGAFEVAYSSGLELAWSGATINDSITLTLTGFADAQVTNDGYALFGTGGWKSEWAGRILVKGTTAEGKQLTLDENGKVVILADGKDLYWSGSGTDTELTWGANGGNEWAEGSSTGNLTAWTTNSNVYLGATGAANVTLKDATITAASITFTAANGTDGYTFTSDVEGGSTLLVRGNMSNKNDNSSVAVKAVFDDKVNVRVMGDFISTGAKGDFLFKKKLTVDGLLQLWNGSVLELDEGGDVGTLDASWNSVQIKLGGDLKVGNWFFEGNPPGGHQVSFTRTGDNEVFIDVGRVVGGQSGTQSQAGTLSERELTINGTGVMTIGEGVGIKKSSGTLTFGGSTTFAVGGSYAAVSGGEMVFNVDATAGMNVEIGEGSSITVNEGKSLTATGKLKGTGGALLLESSATATFTGGVDTSSNLTSLQLAQGAKLSALGASTLDVGTLTLTGNATIELDGTQEGSIKLGNAIVGSDDHVLTISLTGLTDDGSTALLTDGYQLFDTSMSNGLLQGLKTLFDEQKLLILLGDCTYDYQLGENGKLTFTNDTVTLTHTGNGSSFMWDSDSATWDESGQTFAGANSVKFIGTGNNTVNLAISGATTVKMMTVQTTDGGVYTFAPASGSNTLTVTSRLELESAAVFQVGTEVRGEMRGKGALTVDGKTFNLSSARAHSWTGELTVQNAGTFSLAGTVTATKFTVGTDGGTVDLSGAGAVLTVAGDIAGDGNALTLTGGGKLDWTGTTGTLGSANIENGEFAIGGTLTMGGNIALGQDGKISGTGTIGKKSGLAGDVYVQFQVSEDESAGKAVDAWVTDKLGGLQLGDGVSLQKSGEGMLTFGSGGTLSKALDIAEGSVKFDGNNYTVSEALTGAGTLIIATAGPNRTVTLSKGANMTGDLSLSCYGGSVTLGADATFGGLVNDGDNFDYLSTGGRTHGIKSGDSNVTLTLNVAAGEKEAKGVNIGEGVKVVKDGEGTQKFTEAEDTDNGRVTLAGGLEVNKGLLEITGEHSTIGGALTGETEGTLRLVSGNLAISGGGTYSGTLEMADGKITVSGEALEVGTFKATTGELDVQSDLTIGKVDEGSALTTLKIASDTTVAVRAGTLKATTLDLTGTTGASLEVGMDGSAKLDFGSITLGRDGKLSITMTGYDGEKTYQLFESTTFGDVWDALVTGGKQWNEVFDITGIEGRDLTLNRDGSLTIQPKGIEWSGGDDDTWSDEQPGEWEGGTVPPTGRDVTFTAEAAQEHGDVKIDGTVHPRNVYVDSGDYTFMQKEGTTGGLNMSEADGGGTLKVGGGGAEARLTLELENTSVPRVELGNRGTLVLANDKALTDKTEILFSGGVLEYSGFELRDADLSGRILKYGKGGSTGAVKVSVDDATYADGVTWGGAKEDVASNGGLWHAVHESVNQGGGMEKSGTGKLTLEWQEAETETGEPTTHRGAVTVKEGELQYKINTADATDATDVTMRGAVTVEEAGTFTLSVYGKGVVEYIEALNGEGTVSLGGEDGDGTVKLSADSSGFKGTVRITAGIVEVSNENALGGSAPGGEEAATLELSGGNLTGNDITVNTENVLVSGGDAVLSGVTLAGKVTGENGVTAKDGATAGLSGDISEYEGELKTGESGTWILSDKALSQPVGVSVSGNGVVEFAGDATYSGTASGSVTLRGSSGMLTIVTEGSSDGAKLAGNVTLGKAGTKAVWGGREAVDGTITLANVELSNDGGFTIENGAKLCVTTAAADEGGSSIVDVNGMRGERLDDITINQHGELCNITGKYTANSTHHLALHFSAENVGDAVDDLAALITGREGGKFELDAGSKDDVDLLLETDALASIVGRLAAATSDKTVDVYLRLVGDEDTLTMRGIGLDHLLDVLDGDSAGILSSLYIESVSVEKGCIKLTGSAADVFVAPKGTYTLEDAVELDKAGATVLANTGDHLILKLTPKQEEGPDVTVRNLLGVTKSRLSLQRNGGEGQNRLTVAFNNTHSSTLANADKYPDETVYGQDTTFNGSIDGGAGVDVEKQGLGTLTVGGGYKLADGTTTLTAGALRLRGAENTENSMGNLAFSYTGAPKTNGKQGADGETKAEERGLLLEGGVTTITGSIKDEENEGKGNDIVMSRGAELVLKGATTLSSTGIIGDEKDGGGKLTLDGSNAGLTLGAKIDENGKVTGAAQLSGVDVRLTNGGNLTIGENAGMDVGEVMLGENGTLDIGSGTANHVDFLNSITEEDITDGTGNGTLRSAEDNGKLKSAGGGELHVGGGTFSGTLDSSSKGGKAGKLVVDSGAEFTLDNVTTDKTKGWGVTLNGGSTLTVDVSKGKGAYFGDINLGNGKMMFNFGEQKPEPNSLSGTIKEVGEKGTLDFFSVGKVENSQEGKWEWKTGITVAGSLRDSFADHVTFTGGGSFLEDSKASVDKDTGALTVTTEAAKDNKFERLLPDMSKNARAGATMVWDSLKEKSQDEAFFNALLNPTSDYDRMASALIGLYDNGDKEGLEKALVAVAGSSVSVLGPAVVEDLHRQLTTMRNRTTMTTNEQRLEQYDVYPMWHAWLNAEGAYRKLDADGFAPGYTLNSWGGTVGVDSDVSERTIVGLALTAMYGDLKTDGADVGKGDLDTMYFSAFARTTRGAWSHTFVVSGGIADVSLDRTVNAGGVSYRTQGSTDGYAVGALYEVGYTKLMNRRGTIAFQPVFNVEIRHAAIKGYTETGSNAGLKADDIEQNVVTFGVGARMQSIVGENAYNRASILEARLLVKGDVGDRSGVAKNALTGSTSVGEVESAEVGAFGVEAGVGLTVPLGSQMGNLFIDGSMELRKGQTGFDATLGYRISF